MKDKKAKSNLQDALARVRWGFENDNDKAIGEAIERMTGIDGYPDAKSAAADIARNSGFAKEDLLFLHQLFLTNA